MILIFDLDDTLYSEFSFVKSGFMAVAKMLELNYGWDSALSFNSMLRILKSQGRGEVFNNLLQEKEVFSKALVNLCLQTYRQHFPKIHLYPEALEILKCYSNYPKYIVTDGNKNVQANKVEALRLKSLFKKIYITHCYGIKNAKPSLHCFDLIRKYEKSNWKDLTYIGDNPKKDFVNLNSAGARTIRVLNGEYANIVAKQGYDAQFTIPEISKLGSVLKGL